MMSQHGAALQTYNQELVKCLEEMKMRRTELQSQIEFQEEEKNNLQREIEKMSYKLTFLSDSLAKKIAVKNEYDRTIADTETAYMKRQGIQLRPDGRKRRRKLVQAGVASSVKKNSPILESSQLLLNMIKKEAISLDQTLVKANIDKQQYRQ